jgi:hypothetical protein
VIDAAFMAAAFQWAIVGVVLVAIMWVFNLVITRIARIK